MPDALISIARFTLLEGRRSRLLRAALALVVGAAAVAGFAAALAITDTQSYRSELYAACVRLAMVLLLTLMVCAGVTRELADRMLDLTLSRAVSRSSWYLGRLLGFAALAAMLALMAALPLTLVAPPPAVAAWGVSLAAELCVVAAAALACAVTLRQLTAAVTVTLAFYLLARAIDAIVLMSRGPTVDPGSLSAALIARAVELLALLLPALDRFTASAWLAQASWPHGLGGVLLEAVLYVALLATVGLFDVHRLDD